MSDCEPNHIFILIVLTKVDTIQASFDEVIQFQQKFTRFCEERHVLCYIFDVRPDDSVSDRGLKSRGTPDFDVVEGEDTKTVELGSVSGDGKVKSDRSP